MLNNLKSYRKIKDNKTRSRNNETQYTQKQIKLIYFLRRFSLVRSSRSSALVRFDDELEDGLADGAEPLPCRTSFKKSLKPNGSSSR
jgi:hypothetical protein